MALTKTIQRHIYSCLSSRYGITLSIVGFILALIFSFELGELAIKWSKVQYASTFDSFYDNLAGQSYQDRICTPMPIDVVYTWVNGSDPKLIRELTAIKRQMQQEVQEMQINMFYEECPHLKNIDLSKLRNFTLLGDCAKYLPDTTVVEISHKHETASSGNSSSWCSFVNCIPSTIIVLEGSQLATDVTLLSIRELHESLSSVRWIANVTNAMYKKLSYAVDVEKVENVRFAFKSKIEMHDEQLAVSKAYLTSNKVEPLGVALERHILVTGLPIRYLMDETYLRKRIKVILKKYLRNETLPKIKAYATQGTILVELSEKYSGSKLSETKLIKFNGHLIKVYQAYLVWAPRRSISDGDDNDADPDINMASNRFSDNQELRFSIRSVERYAPWVRKIFIVTNGQIPSWLNLENPRVQIVTHEIYLTWPVPNCNEGCPPNWIRDGYCDKACNTSSCDWDGGDCLGGTEAGQATLHGIGQNAGLHQPAIISYCNLGCADSWVGDKYCDQSCDVASCGFDGGDCGTARYSMLYRVDLHNTTTSVIVPHGLEAMYINLTEVFQYATITDAEYDGKSCAIRTAVVSEKAKVLTFLFYEASKMACNDTQIKVTLVSSSDTATRKPNKTLSLTMQNFWKDNPNLKRYRPSLAPRSLSWDNITISDLDDISTSLNRSLITLKNDYNSGYLTRKGYEIRKSQLLISYVKARLDKKRNVNEPRKSKAVHSSPRRLLSYSGRGSFPWEKQRMFDSLIETKEKLEAIEQLRPKPVIGRKLLEAFKGSLQHVNRIYNKMFGYVVRKIPAHISHMMDKDILQELHDVLPQEFEKTSAHRLRSPDDMQFSFSYYYYIMGKMEELNVSKFFKDIDTDNSGVLSDRELRTLVSRILPLPVSFQALSNVEKTLINCSVALNMSTTASTEKLAKEMYFEAKLPPITLELISSCDPIVSLINESYTPTNKHKFETVDDENVAFKMLRNNVTTVMIQLDSIRRDRKKFICLNDDIDHEHENAILIKGLLIELYETLFPTPSQFELPRNYRNRFLYVKDLEEWARKKRILRMWAYTIFYIILLFTLFSFIYGRIVAYKRRYARRQRSDSSSEERLLDVYMCKLKDSNCVIKYRSCFRLNPTEQIMPDATMEAS
ncbi:uncharacterized protein TRIADDRAFT_51611 [Trichoplax adhaerens]|uniref:N-acetylglucosamine-1-phosphotransferase subunits alpha/beta n=1 Tax=Trichoplax adhaerens TaxID=10228 RepID=B3RK37_TRIAD|nr:hypothetical protein TRIADDRAFT_51611 [Trichoplax adhaerens]EDV28564.1 hypothetical protein TRIADDRAFT_51611 [Trichoplax adhaerens]|eukprot:XP_002107766.1 hypothetical protein TRIADDRAFT_51611 [Trichoplax adhaerens]